MMRSLYKRLPGYWRLSNALRRRYDQYGANPFIKFAPPGHFYSPLPDIAFVDRYKQRLFDRQISGVPGIEVNPEAQLALIDELSVYYGDQPFPDTQSSDIRYYYENPFFSYGDAIILYSMLRHRQPRRIIEVGSGFSSAVMLDTNDRFLSGKIAFTFVEPYPERLLSLLNENDKKKHEIVVKIVQEVSIEKFAALEAGDILFIDSSHVAKIGSDVVHLLTHVLPALKAGVMVHFHDIFWPFEYPESWIREGRAWNENYMLKAFLQFNQKFKVRLFNSYLATHYRDIVGQRLPLFLKNSGGSLWLEAVA